MEVCVVPDEEWGTSERNHGYHFADHMGRQPLPVGGVHLEYSK